MTEAKKPEEVDYSKDNRDAPLERSMRVFPPYLNEGSEGYAVELLWGLLAYLGFWDHFVHAGVAVYAQGTVASVKKLQGWLGFEGADVDGNFGPGTRERLLLHTGIAVDRAISSRGQLEERPTRWMAPDGVMRVWPPEITER